MAAIKETTTLKITGLRHPVFKPSNLKVIAARRLKVPPSAIQSLKVLRRATDARQRRVDFVYTVLVQLHVAPRQTVIMLQQPGVTRYQEHQFCAPALSQSMLRPIIVGCGPAGLFAALTLVERGMRPIVFEQGERISERTRRVERFWRRGTFHPLSNVLFGEGGAGTFSDGKLTTRIKSPLKEKVLTTLIAYGAPEEIAYVARPHIGTDRLRSIIPAMVDDLQHKGVDFYFSTPVTDLEIQQGRIVSVIAHEKIPVQYVFWASGHSSRDSYRMLRMKGALFERKGFAIGLRIEHPQEFINQAIMKGKKNDPRVLPASYTLTYKDPASGRGVYSFCMCPGGKIIACADTSDGLWTNGMSTYQRQTPWANAALVVTVQPRDFMGSDPFSGIEFQTMLERQAYTFGGGGFKAPVQLAADFISDSPLINPCEHRACSYRPGITVADLRSLLPVWIRDPLQRALRAFDEKIPGFVSEGILVGIETRTSAPLRIVRDPVCFHALGIQGLIPIGEGSGYAGGIMSSAVDGIQAALAFDSGEV